MLVRVLPDKVTVGREAAARAAALIRQALEEKSRARIVAATGASQFEFLDALCEFPAVDWTRVEMFHLDEYVGLPQEHPASFRRYLRDRLVRRTGIREFWFLDGDKDPREVCFRIGRALVEAPVDVAFVGIGENGHLAFNDPPADFQTEEPFIVVQLDENCRRQQLGEGWFEAIEQVPKQAITMSVRQILKSRAILCIAPESRKAKAVAACFSGGVSPWHPASILQTHGDTTVYLDEASAALTPGRFAARLLEQERSGEALE